MVHTLVLMVSDNKIFSFPYIRLCIINWSPVQGNNDHGVIFRNILVEFDKRILHVYTKYLSNLVFDNFFLIYPM